MKGALKGLIRLQENENGQLRFSGEISGLKPPGNHGFHVHQVFYDDDDNGDDDNDDDEIVDDDDEIVYDDDGDDYG